VARRSGRHAAVRRRRHATPRRVPGGVVAAVVAALGLGAGGTAVVTSTHGERTVASSGDLPAVAPVVSLPAPAAPPAAPRTRAAAPRVPAAPSVPAVPLPRAPLDALAGLRDALFDAGTGDFVDKFDNNGRSGLVENGRLPRVVSNPDDPGRSAWRFSLGAGGKRSEVLPQGRGTEPTDGDVQWVRYSAVLDDAFPTTTDEWQLILQWHHDSPTGSPPLALQVTKGQLMMVSEGTDMKAIGPVSPGQRVDLVMRVAFDQDPTRGTVTVWRDGKATGVTGWHPPDGTMSTRSAYLKMGLYRSTAITQPGSVTVTDLKIGPSARSIGGTGDLPR
jgi:hypothetical protein